MQVLPITFAATYDCGTYGSGTYDNNTCSSSSSTTSNGAGSSTLTNTGFDILLIVTLACFLVFIALLVRFWKRPRRQSAE